MSFWVREVESSKGKWVPDIDEGMCLCGTREDAMVLLEDYEDNPKYRIRRYVRIERKHK